MVFFKSSDVNNIRNVIAYESVKVKKFASVSDDLNNGIELEFYEKKQKIPFATLTFRQICDTLHGILSLVTNMTYICDYDNIT